ncbi:hypothetical protein BDD12DRAFT_875792 [Trichophaea hybrida]|nr:hypothetical protein BDD12DRAFT_875792 [Trichophaea hybrida]
MSAIPMPSYRFIEENWDCNGQSVLKHTDFTTGCRELGSFEETGFEKFELECISRISTHSFVVLKFFDNLMPGRCNVRVYIHDSNLLAALGDFFGRSDFGIPHATALRMMDEGWLWHLAFMRAQNRAFPHRLNQPLRQLLDEFLKSPTSCAILATGSVVFTWLIILHCNSYKQKLSSTVAAGVGVTWVGAFPTECAQKLGRGFWIDLAMFALKFLSDLLRGLAVVPCLSATNNALQATMSQAFHQLSTRTVGMTIPSNLLSLYMQKGYFTSITGHYITPRRKVLFPLSYPSVCQNLPTFMTTLELALRREICVLKQPIPKHVDNIKTSLLTSSSAPKQSSTAISICPRGRERNDTASRLRCSRCGERFSTVTNFNRHNYASKCGTTGQIFVCRQCGNPYNRKDNRDHHEQKVHGLEKFVSSRKLELV